MRKIVYCHGEDISYGKVRHDSYDAELKVINDGRLRGVVNRLPGYKPMPFDKPKLPACEILLIKTWLDNGAPEK